MSEIGHRRKRQRAMNEVTLQRLAANGSRLDREHDIVCVFHVFHRAVVIRLEQELAHVGYDLPDPVLEREHEGQLYWSLEGHIKVVPSERAIGEITDRAVSIAARLNGEFDGWYCEVVKQ